jgi:hypothetical protein
MFDSHSSYPEKMAEHFAFAEIILELKISNNIVIAPGEFVFLKNTNGVCSKNITHSFDEHSYGVMNTTLINSLYHYTLTSCLHEFIENLKLHKIFDNTLICHGSEFNRSPRINAGGSDHGWSAASVSMYSGLINNGPVFIGDMKKENDENYKGFWGKGNDTNRFRSGKKLGKINIKNLHSSVAVALNVDTPYPESPSLIIEKNNGRNLESAIMKPSVES